MKKAEIYGFVGSIGTVIFYLIYLLWAFTPDHLLRRIGISWYPEKYWALALPSFLIFTVIAIQVIYQGLNMMYTKPFNSIYSTQDEHSRSYHEFQSISKESLPEIYDIPVSVINDLLYYRNKNSKVQEKSSNEELNFLSVRKAMSSLE